MGCCGCCVYELFGTAVGGAGSLRGRIGTTMVGTGLDGSFVPCAQASPVDANAKNTTIHGSFDAPICHSLKLAS
jgi:hypothetical protein